MNSWPLAIAIAFVVIGGGAMLFVAIDDGCPVGFEYVRGPCGKSSRHMRFLHAGKVLVPQWYTACEYPQAACQREAAR